MFFHKVRPPHEQSLGLFAMIAKRGPLVEKHLQPCFDGFKILAGRIYQGAANKCGAGCEKEGLA